MASKSSLSLSPSSSFTSASESKGSWVMKSPRSKSPSNKSLTQSPNSRTFLMKSPSSNVLSPPPAADRDSFFKENPGEPTEGRKSSLAKSHEDHPSVIISPIETPIFSPTTHPKDSILNLPPPLVSSAISLPSIPLPYTTSTRVCSPSPPPSVSPPIPTSPPQTSYELPLPSENEKAVSPSPSLSPSLPPLQPSSSSSSLPLLLEPVSPRSDSEETLTIRRERSRVTSQRGNAPISSNSSHKVTPSPSPSSRSLSPSDPMRGRQATFLVEDMGDWISEKKAITSLLSPAEQTLEAEREKEKERDNKGKRPAIRRPPSTGLFSRANTRKKCVFGQSLADLYEASTSPVPLFVLQCIMYLKSSGALKAEGIFRVSGLKDVIETGKELFQTATDVIDFSVHFGDPNAVASLLKTFYRDLPEPLFTCELSGEAYEAMQRIPANLAEQRVAAVKSLVCRLPLLHAINARFLFEFLHTITMYSAENLMTTQNLAIVWGPNVFRTVEMNIAIASSQYDVAVTEILIDSYDEIFEGVGVGSLKMGQKTEGREGEAVAPSGGDGRHRSPRKLKKGTHDKQPKVRRTPSEVKKEGKSDVAAKGGHASNTIRMTIDHTASAEGELSFTIGDEIVLTSLPTLVGESGEGLEKGGAVGLFGLLTTRTAKNLTTGKEGTISDKFLPTHIVASSIPSERAEVVLWPITPQDEVVECKTVVKSTKTVQEYLRSVAIRSAVDVGELQVGRMQFVPVGAEERLLEALESGGGPLVIVRNGKITETICVTQNLGCP